MFEQWGKIIQTLFISGTLSIRYFEAFTEVYFIEKHILGFNISFISEQDQQKDMMQIKPGKQIPYHPETATRQDHHPTGRSEEDSVFQADKSNFGTSKLNNIILIFTNPYNRYYCLCKYFKSITDSFMYLVLASHNAYIILRSMLSLVKLAQSIGQELPLPLALVNI